jgi:branched-chain amino acid transport system ATP-binding protein
MSAMASSATMTAAGAAEPMLVVDDAHTYYGQIHALQGISLEVGKGEIVTLIGANGAGKTTTLKTISGMLHPRHGTVRFEGDDISRVPAHKLVERGIGHAPEGRRIFSRLTVLENLQMGAFSRRIRADGDGRKRRFAWLRDAGRNVNIQPDIDRVFALFPRLKERTSQLGGTLSGGEQQMLAIGRALMSEPRILLLDEPSLGLSPILVQLVFETIKDINSQGTTVLLVEQNALQALSIAHRGYVLQTGEVVLAGEAGDLIQNEMVRKAYLGED